MRPTEVLVLSKKRRWFAWRDLVALLLAITVVLLVENIHSLQQQVARKDAESAQRFDEYNRQLAQLRAQLGVKDTRIRQLTNQLVRNGITPEPAPLVTPVPSPSPQASRSRTPAPKPTRSPSPSPSPSPSCPLPLPLRCITPPPMVWLLAPLPFLLL